MAETTSSQRIAKVFDYASYPEFKELLQALQQYANLSGYRFRLADFHGTSRQNTPVLTEAQKHKGIVDEWMCKIKKLKDGPFAHELFRALRRADKESVRNVMLAACQELGLPQAHEDTGVLRSWQDLSVPLEEIAAALSRSAVEAEDAAYCSNVRTASFIADFAHAAGLPDEAFSFSEHRSLLSTFFKRLKEYAEKQAKGNASVTRESVKTVVIKAISIMPDNPSKSKWIRETEEWFENKWNDKVAVGVGVGVVGVVMGALWLVSKLINGTPDSGKEEKNENEKR